MNPQIRADRSSTRAASAEFGAAARTPQARPATAAPPSGDDARVSLYERLAFLNDATVRIGDSLDLDLTVRELGSVVVPSLADFATVHLLDVLCAAHWTDAELPDTAQAVSAPVRRVVVVHDEEPGRWRGVVPEGDVQTLRPSSPIRQAMATGAPVLVPRVDQALASVLAHSHPGDDPTPLVLDRSMLVVPLRVRGRTLGTVTLLRRADREPFDELDVLMARQLAAQASLGVDNANRYRAEARIADALQRSMLPVLPARMAGVDIADRYLSCGQTAQVGGDWFDAIPLPGSRVAFVVGDVMGHGIPSAAAMGQLRTAVRTLAALDMQPDRVLRHLDDTAQRLGDNSLATCVYAVYDPVARRLSVANAGHIPPVLARPGTPASQLDLPTGAPLGVGGVAFETVEVPVADGDVLVLCTDGLVEVRGQDIDTGLKALRTNLAEPELPLDTLCERVLAALHVHDREDDAALLMTRLRGIPSDDVAHWLLEPRPSTPARVRHLVRTTLAGWGLSACADVTELLATELVTNAVRYASQPIEVRLLRADALLCEVTDDHHHRPVLRHAADTDEGGRGLQLVSRLARRWGASGKSTGKVVWFEQDLPASEPE